MTGRYRVGVAFSLAAGMTACTATSTESGGLATSTLRPAFTVNLLPGGQTNVIAQLYSGITAIQLSAGDALVAVRGGIRQTLAYGGSLQSGAYYGGTVGIAATGDEVTISFERTSGQSAPNSSVRVPLDFTLEAPTLGTPARAGGNVLVRWSVSGTNDAMQVTLVPRSCTNGGAGLASTQNLPGDTGQALVDVPVTVIPPDLPGDGACIVDLTLARIRIGTTDPAYLPGGTIEARHSATVGISVTK